MKMNLTCMAQHYFKKGESMLDVLNVLVDAGAEKILSQEIVQEGLGIPIEEE